VLWFVGIGRGEGVSGMARSEHRGLLTDILSPQECGVIYLVSTKGEGISLYRWRLQFKYRQTKRAMTRRNGQCNMALSPMLNTNFRRFPS
jgi:hypothetical protein